MKQPQILLAEDNPALQNVIRYNLSAVGMDVHVASRGDDALKVFNSRHFDCMICDHQMPGMMGVDLIRAIREGDHNREIPIVLCTSRVLDLDQKYIKEDLGVTIALGKPFSVRQIVSTVLEVTNSIRTPLPT